MCLCLLAVPSLARGRGVLLIHELFHRIQPGLPQMAMTPEQKELLAATSENDHLDTLDGRYWMQLEWRALSHALTSSGAARAAAIGDALAFRRARRATFPAGATRECAEEINEGLAEYTGIVVTAPSTAEAIALAVRQLAASEQEESFVRRFHAASGPAYGLLLDAFAPGWTRRVTAVDDLAQMLTTAAKVEPAHDAAASAVRYRSAELRAAAEKRDVEHTLSGKGWTITLAAGWTVHPGKRPGDFEIVKAAN